MARAKINLEKITQCGLDQAQAEGYENLSLIYAAKKLGIKSPSLFNHIQGLDDLKHLVALRILEDLRDSLQEAVKDKVAEGAVMSLSLGFRDWAKRNAGLYPAIRGISPESHPEEADLFYQIMRIFAWVFEGGHLSDEERVHQSRALRAMLHGWVELEREGSFVLAKDLDWSFAKMISAFAKSAFEMA